MASAQNYLLYPVNQTLVLFRQDFCSKIISIIERGTILNASSTFRFKPNRIISFFGKPCPITDMTLHLQQEPLAKQSYHP
jgi:hypothetical protein